MRSTARTKSGGWSGIQTYAYSDDSDSPAWLAEGSNWTRWIAGLDGSVDATQKSDGTLAWTISNIRGDMIAEAGGTGLMNVREIDEFGNAEGGLPSSRPYGFHGSKERETLTDGGTIAMGVRLYVPGSGRFLQTDPVLGGSAGPYDYANQDPINSSDLDGRKPKKQAFKLTMRLGPRQVRKMLRAMRAQADALSAQMDTANIIKDVAGLGAGALGALKAVGTKFLVAAAVIGGAALIKALAVREDLRSVQSFIRSMSRRFRECHGRGVNIVVRGIRDQDGSAKVNIYRSGKGDIRGTADMAEWDI